MMHRCCFRLQESVNRTTNTPIVVVNTLFSLSLTIVSEVEINSDYFNLNNFILIHVNLPKEGHCAVGIILKFILLENVV